MPLTPVQQPALPKAMLLKPLSSGEPPPVLAKEYPGDAAADPQDWTSPAGLHASGPKGEGRSPRVHKIADGDTLRGLAERYLGSAARFLEIYEANRGLLSSPEILPIGAALRIPARQRQGPSPSNFMPKPPLVPVSGNEDEQ
jgi:nucleoid-associated protein YgaU